MVKRLPLSCENCRRRKIRCLGSGVPCDTCQRRGVASTCHFKRDPLPEPGREPCQDALLQRIANLEALLQQNIELTATSITLQQNGTQQSTVAQSDLSVHQNTSYRTPTSIPSGSFSQPHDTLEPQHDSAGSIITSSTGHIRYIPFNSGNDTDLLNRFQNPLHIGNSSENLFGSETSGSIQTVLDILPPSRQCDELLAVFLEVFSPLFHIIYEPNFRSMYSEFKRNRQAAPKAFTGLLFVTLALAITALHPEDPLLSDLGGEDSSAANAKSLAAKYRSAAMKCLAADDFLWQHNMYTLQCLVFLIYAINHAQGPAWSLLGTTLNIAVAIGCHVDPARLNVTFIQAEERRRAWAGLMMLYTIQNTCLGSIAPFEITNDVRLPLDMEDDEITAQSFSVNDLDIINTLSGSRPPTRMSYILFKFRLYRLASDICHLTSAPTALPQFSRVHSLDDRLHAEKREQIKRFGGHSNLPTYHRAHSFILDNYTNHLLLLLHRPILTIQYPMDPKSISTSYERCEKAAYAIISTYENLHTWQEFRSYSWYTHGIGAFHAFFAMTTLLVCLGQAEESAISKQTCFQAVQTCLQKFQEATPFSEICDRAYSILSPLVIGEIQPPVMSPGESSATLGSGGAAENSFESMTRDTREECEGFLPNAWALPEDLEQMISKVSCEQWLSPAAFPWVDALHF
ncbi:hypothetical protein N7486_001097 [Penicillium sp. IBT 16267x]|nr:hypothetical protein N7486_001097 [Penicillium sp. IBT 16267x]